MTTDGVATDYLARVPSPSLVCFGKFTDRIGKRSPKLADWLTLVVDDELQKRISITDLDTVPHEPARPTFPIGWSPEELAACLAALHLASASITDPAIVQWLFQVMGLSIALAAADLQQYQGILDRSEEQL